MYPVIHYTCTMYEEDNYVHTNRYHNTLVDCCHRRGYLHKREDAVCDEMCSVTGNMPTNDVEAQSVGPALTLGPSAPPCWKEYCTGGSGEEKKGKGREGMGGEEREVKKAGVTVVVSVLGEDVGILTGG